MLINSKAMVVVSLFSAGLLGACSSSDTSVSREIVEFNLTPSEHNISAEDRFALRLVGDDLILAVNSTKPFILSEFQLFSKDDTCKVVSATNFELDGSQTYKIMNVDDPLECFKELRHLKGVAVTPAGGSQGIGYAFYVEYEEGNSLKDVLKSEMFYF